MICTTIQNKSAEQILEALTQCEMAEIRLDRCDLSAKEIEDVFSSDVPLVATCRIAEIAATEPSLQELAPQSREIKAAQIAEQAHIPMMIVNGVDPDILYDIMDGKPCGTIIYNREA